MINAGFQQSKKGGSNEKSQTKTQNKTLRNGLKPNVIHVFLIRAVKDKKKIGWNPNHWQQPHPK
jgi:hypothetical protein